jgi:hypothetical protein
MEPDEIYQKIIESKNIHLVMNWASNPNDSWIIHQRHKNKNDISAEIPPQEVIDTLKHYFEKDKRNVTRFLKTIKKYNVDLVDKTYFQPTIWNAFGCPKSTDIDIVIIVEPDVIENQSSYTIDLSVIQQEVSKLFPDKEMDYNYICLNERRNISRSTKGSHETQNMVFSTYQFHKQCHPVIFKNLIELSESDKSVRPIVQYICLKPNSKKLIGNTRYSQLRETRKSSETDCDKRFMYSVEVFKESMKNLFMWKFELNTLSCKFELKLRMRTEMYDFMKGFLMKIIQLLQRINHGYEHVSYTKDQLAEASAEWFTKKEGLRYFLMRGREGNIYDTLDTVEELIISYENLVINEINNNIPWNKVILDTSINPTKMNEEVFKELIDSPIECNDSFIEKFSQYHGNINSTNEDSQGLKINELFETKSNTFNEIPKELHSIIEDCDQRTPEWQRLLKFYTCGLNTGLTDIPEGVHPLKVRYNLIRGCVFEEFASKYLTENINSVLTNYNLTGYEPYSVGLMVKEKDVQGSIGAAPDMLLINKNLDIISVEIKTMKSSFKLNVDYRRALDLATKQCKTINTITKNCMKGLIVMLWYDNGQWELFHHLIEF